MKKTILAASLFAAISTISFGQIPDTTGIYGERKDSLGAAVATGRLGSNPLLKTKEIRTEVITASGLCKMACCNLAESFENTASVSVGYSDAVTGARQIRLLGQSGIYTQMLDENRPTMRGLSSPWGLTFVPSQWLQSIQIAKGVTSVINGVESMTGQINLEHRKPNDEHPLFLQASVMSDTKTDANMATSFCLDESETWSTVIMGHIDGNFKTFDQNGDGFMDDPKTLNVSFANRWLYFGDDGVQIRFGIRGLQDRRNGGQMNPAGWQSNILNRQAGAFVKGGFPLNEENSRNFAFITDYSFQSLQSSFGMRNYNARQHSAFANLIYQDHSIEQHYYTVGISGMVDYFDETLASFKGNSTLSDLGAYGEYTFHSADETTFSAIAGVRADWFNKGGVKVSPRLTLKWEPLEQLVFRANGGRGIRYSTPIADNIGVLSTGKALDGDLLSHPLEESWTFGANATWYLPFDKKGKAYLSFDYFHTSFTEKLIADYIGDDSIAFRLLSDTQNGFSKTDNFQLDFFMEPIDGLTFNLTGRYTDAKESLLGCASSEKPLQSRFKGVFNVQYATPRSGWVFDFTASVNGPCRVWDFMLNDPKYASGYTSAYPLLFAQITKKFKKFELYFGGENLTGFRQDSPIIMADAPYSSKFDASCVWGPLSGVKFYGGFRLNLSSPHEHEHHHEIEHAHEHNEHAHEHEHEHHHEHAHH